MSGQTFRNNNFDSRYFALQEYEDKVLQLEETVAIRPFEQTKFAISRWDDPGTGVPIPDNAGAMLNSTVFLDNSGNITDLNSLSILENVSDPDPTKKTLWINSVDGKLYRNNVNLEDTGVITPIVTTNNGLALWDGITGNSLKNSSITSTGTDISGITTINGNPIGTGDVVGPVSSTNDTLAAFDGTTGKLLKNTSLFIQDSGQSLFAIGTVTAGLLNSDNLSEKTLNAGVTVESVNFNGSDLTNVANINTRNVNDFITGPPISLTKRLTMWEDTSGDSIISTNLLITGAGNDSILGLDEINNKEVDLLTTYSGTVSDNRLARWDGSTGILQTSPIIVGDAGELTNVLEIDGKLVELLVVSPDVAVIDNSVARYNGVGGQSIQTSPVIIGDLGEITGVLSINGKVADNLITTTETNVFQKLTRFDSAAGIGVDATGIGADANDNLTSVNSIEFNKLALNPGADKLWMNTSDQLQIGPDRTIAEVDIYQFTESFTKNLSGGITSVSGVFQKIGGVVNLIFSTVSANLNGSNYLTYTFTGISEFLPTSGLRTDVYAVINGGNFSGIGIASISSTGECRIYYDDGSNNWTAGTSNSGWSTSKVTYSR